MYASGFVMHARCSKIDAEGLAARCLQVQKETDRLDIELTEVGQLLEREKNRLDVELAELQQLQMGLVTME
jgi:hypothetical protein